MKAWAPGKLVLSGAYCVLEGAPAIVSAVDRYVSCDSERRANIVTPEVRSALPEGTAPYFDAEALRAEGRKLGLGSSAAILVASLAVLEPGRFSSDGALRQAIAPRALSAHHQAQGGGSGIDVAAAIWGGTLIARRTTGTDLELEPVELPRGLCVEAWASGAPASTSLFLASVAQLRQRSERQYQALMDALAEAARAAAQAVRAGWVPEFVEQLTRQRHGLDALGRAAGIPIVTPEVRQLAECVGVGAAAVLPSGAGGGDIVLWVASAPSPPEFRKRAAARGHFPVDLSVHARGVHRFIAEGSGRRL